MKKTSLFIIFLFIITLVILSSCDTLFPAEENGLNASGVIEAVQIDVSPEVGGRVAEVFVNQGTLVEQGDILFRLEPDSLIAQRNQALVAQKFAQAQLDSSHTSLDAAQAALSVAEAGVESARAQYELVLENARFQDQPQRIESWNEEIPGEFSLPTWYFQKEEAIKATEYELEQSKESYDIETANFESIRDLASNADLKAAEERLINAQTAFTIAENLLDRDIQRDGKEEIEDYLKIIHEDAKAELEAAQSAYETMLSDQSFTDVLEARARLAVARERYETAMDHLNLLLTGGDALTVKAAQAGIVQAEAVVEQAQANLAQAASSIAQGEQAVAQAEAGVEIIDLQIDKLEVPAAVSGVIMTRNIEPGEIIQPGTAAFTIGRLDQLTIKVYVPENLYGQINLGDPASVQVDSYPGETFSAQVIRIADQAEYTPRNVQTQEDRQTTVFEIELSVDDPLGKLKPGMPADVNFQ
jgi:HlyD family secretion protein